jgi:hypothetical protein
MFSPSLYGRFLTALRDWGTEHLGCAAVSDPWLSYYIDGGRQELHTDSPHGPWSYVFSLTRDAGFTGGETLLLRDDVLDYWAAGFGDGRALERDDLMHRVSSEFDQLVVFDARVPHGVSVVEGTSDPLRGRVVLHGWFQPPALTIRGALRPDQLAEVTDDLRRRWDDIALSSGPLHGVAVWQVSIEPDGSADPRLLSRTLVGTAHGAEGAESAVTRMTEHLAATRFPTASGPSSLCFPVSASSH